MELKVELNLQQRMELKPELSCGVKTGVGFS